MDSRRLGFDSPKVNIFEVVEVGFTGLDLLVGENSKENHLHARANGFVWFKLVENLPNSTKIRANRDYRAVSMRSFVSESCSTQRHSNFG